MAQRNTAGTLAWYDREAGSPPFDPDGMCLKICRVARNIPAKYPSAKVAQDATPAKYRITKISDIRRGMVMYFDDPRDGNPYGHVATVIGRVRGADRNSLASIVVWTNSVVANKIVKVRADYFPRYWGDEFKFAATWLNGVELDLPNTTLPPPKPKQPERNRPKTYTVRRGDTLSAIGTRFKLDWRKIAKWSKIKDPNRIEVGQVLRLTPPPKKKPAPKPKPTPKPSGKHTPDIDGVDISHHQGGVINYTKAKRAGVKFIYHKATEGATFTDRNYTRRRNEARAARIPFGAYHFARPDRGDAAAEARKFLMVAAPRRGDLLPVLDLEDDGGMNRRDLTRWVGNWVAVVERALKVKPIIYTSTNWELNNNFGCKLWVPRYNNQNANPAVPEPWDGWDIWQFSNGVYGRPNSVPGFGHVDINTLRRGLSVSDIRIK